jgi:hypothetical protein
LGKANKFHLVRCEGGEARRTKAIAGPILCHRPKRTPAKRLAFSRFNIFRAHSEPLPFLARRSPLAFVVRKKILLPAARVFHKKSIEGKVKSQFDSSNLAQLISRDDQRESNKRHEPTGRDLDSHRNCKLDNIMYDDVNALITPASRLLHCENAFSLSFD